MKLFCSTAITGEDEAQVMQRMQLVVEALHTAGHEAYCQPQDAYVNELKTKGVKVVMQYAFEKIVQCDALVAVITSDRKSEGLLMEVGAALALGKPIYLFWRASADVRTSHLPKIATKIFEWTSEDDLQKALVQI